MESEIIHHEGGGTTLAGTDAVRMFQAYSLSSGITLYLKHGIKPSRMHTPTNMREAATRITGKEYKRNELAQAAADLKTWADTMKAALPHLDGKGNPL